jgi:hypothetical protein
MNKTQVSKSPSYWEPLIFRPMLPEGWYVEEQLGSARNERTTFVRYGKIHHTAPPTKIYVVFIEFNQNYGNSPDYRFTVRGGLHAKPNSELNYFTSIKEAEACIRFLCETTDQWLADVISPEAVEAYDKKINAIKKMVEAE